MSQCNASHSEKQYSYKAFLNHKLENRINCVHNHIINSYFTVCLRESYDHTKLSLLCLFPLLCLLVLILHPFILFLYHLLSLSFLSSSFSFILLPVFHVLQFLLLFLFISYIFFPFYYSSSFSSSPPFSP